MENQSPIDESQFRFRWIEMRERLNFKFWFRFLNYPLVKPLDMFNISLSQPRYYISHSAGSRLRSNGSTKTWPSGLVWFTLIIIILQIVRSWAMSFVFNDDHHFLVTCFGSIFALAHIKRRYVELCVFLISVIVLLYLLVINSKWNYFFAYFTQYLDQSSSFEQQNKQAFNLPRKVANRFVSRRTRYFHGVTIVAACLLGNVYITGYGIIIFGDPYQNNYHLFDHNPYIYYGLYANGSLLAWITWAWCCAGLGLGFFAYFMTHMELVQCKAETLQIQLKRLSCLIKSRRNCGQFMLTHRFHRHLVRVKQLIEEISITNSFWSLYLSITQLIFRSLICYCLHIVLLSKAVLIFRIFITILAATMITIFVATITAAAKVFKQVQICYPLYHQLVVNDVNSLNFQTRFKIFTTIDLISIRAIGFGFVDRKMIKNSTIIDVVYKTMTIFFLVVNNTI